MVNFDSTVNTLAVVSYLVNQKDGERGVRERFRGIRIDFHLGRLSAGFPEYSSAKEGAATMSSKSSSWERRLSLIFQLFPRLAKAAIKSEMNVFDHGCLSLGLSDAGPSGAAKTAWILCGSNWTSCPRCIDFFKRTRTNNMISVIRIYLLLANSSNDSWARRLNTCK